jgi:hypothetical protein
MFEIAFHSAFLNGALDPDEAIFIELPPAVDLGSKDELGKLRVALHGSKQGAMVFSISTMLISAVPHCGCQGGRNISLLRWRLSADTSTDVIGRPLMLSSDIKGVPMSAQL